MTFAFSKRELCRNPKYSTGMRTFSYAHGIGRGTGLELQHVLHNWIMALGNYIDYGCLVDNHNYKQFAIPEV